MPPLDTLPWGVVLAPLMLVAAGFVAARAVAVPRLAVAAGVWSVVGYYLWWRLTTTLPWHGSPVGIAWSLLCLAVELLGLFDAAILYAALVRVTDRSPEADLHAARLRSLPVLPRVDLFIATYNEGLDVLEKTIVGARALDWPDLDVWVLDDGRRAWLAEYCAGKGVGYITRSDNAHAKAGNINHALTVTSAPFVAVFDADFVPQREFLMRTMGFFDDPKIGLVQVPHSFYNHDPLQANLALRDAIPDDQRFFFEAIMPGRDGWDASFCCGSNSVTRRAAFEAAGGGLPTGSITEDMLLTLALLRQGYVTRYLNEPLAFGLAPESLAAFFVQRARWAQGAMQILFLKEGPLGPGLGLRHRLFFLPTAWLSQCLMLLMALFAPLVFLTLDLPPLVNVNAASVFHYLLPMVAATVGGIVLLGGGRYYPIAAQVLGTFQSFRLLPVILKTLWQPHGHAFKVTPKGSDAGGGGYERPIFFACSGLIAATMLALVVNASPDWRIVAQGALVPMVAFWCGVNILTLFLAAMLCLQLPARRAEERFATAERVVVRRLDSNVTVAVPARDVSLSGIAVTSDVFEPGERVRVRLAGVGSLDGSVARTGNGLTGIAFDTTDCPARDRLIVRLFTGGRNTDALRPSVGAATRAVLGRIWGADMALPAHAPPPPAPPVAAVKLDARQRVVPPRRAEAA